MKFSIKHTDKVVGLFIMITIALIFSSVILILLNQKVFVKKHYFHTVFDNKSGLNTNTEITFNGFVIGKLVKFKLNNEDRVDVDFYIYDQYLNRITIGSVLNRSASPLGSAAVIYIKNSHSITQTEPGSFIPSLDTKEGQLLLASGEIKRKADAISNIINNVDELVSSINSDRNPDANSVVRILVNTADVIEKLNHDMKAFGEIVDNFQTLSQQMTPVEGLVQRMVDPTGEYMFNSIQVSLNELAMTITNLNQFSKFMNGQSRQLEQLIIQGEVAVKETQDVIEGLKNNPLLKGGISDKKEQKAAQQEIREW